MTAPAAPLEKAVEAFRAVNMRDRDESCDEPTCIVCARRDAGDALLAALDAAPWWSVWQKTYEHQRKAEDALEEIRDSPTAMGKDIARRYFARRDKLEVPE